MCGNFKWVKPKTILFHPKYLVRVLSAFEVIVLLGFAIYGTYALANRNHNKHYTITPPWPTIVALSYLSVIFSFLLCIGISTRHPIMLMAHLILLACRLTTLIATIIMYVSWSIQAKATVDHLTFSTTKKPIDFWPGAVFGFLAAIGYHIFYFRCVYQVYAYLRSSQTSVTIFHAGNKQNSPDLEHNGAGQIGNGLDQPRASLVEELPRQAPYLAFEVRQPRRKSILKIPEYLGQATERINVYPLKPAQYYYKAPPPLQFRALAMKRGSIFPDPRNAARRETRISI